MYLMKFFLYSLVFTFSMYGMEEERYSHNTYKNIEINPISLLKISPEMPIALKKRVHECVNKYQDLITKLVTTPHPLTHENRKQKTRDNFAIIKEYEDRGEVKNLSDFNYVLRFRDYPEFTIPINRWGSRVAYWIHASGEGDPLNPNFNADSVNCATFEYLPSYQHCSRVAHYLRLKEIIEKDNFQYFKSTPTYFAHIPQKPQELSDENYVVIQKWIDDLKTLKEMAKEQAYEVKKNIPIDALNEIHKATIYAALWDIHSNLAIDGKNPYYYMIDLEEPMNHKPQFFYFRGDEGKEKYVKDTIAALERVAKIFLELPEQFERWQELTKNHKGFKYYCDQYNIYPNFDPEYLEKER